MAYITIEDLNLPAEVLIRLTDDAGAGEVNEEVVNKAISDAGNLIDGFCGGAYTVPFSGPPSVIKKLCVDLTLFELYNRRSLAPEHIRLKRDSALDFLKMVSAGKAVIPGAQGLVSQESAISGAGATENLERKFTRKDFEESGF